MSARERLAEALMNPGLVGLGSEEADELLDAFAHELAEEQRAFAASEGVSLGDDPYLVGPGDIIDPHASASLVRPDEEPTP